MASLTDRCHMLASRVMDTELKAVSSAVLCKLQKKHPIRTWFPLQSLEQAASTQKQVMHLILGYHAAQITPYICASLAIDKVCSSPSFFLHPLKGVPLQLSAPTAHLCSFSRFEVACNVAACRSVVSLQFCCSRLAACASKKCNRAAPVSVQCSKEQ